jgi:hypothetical protein
VADHGGAQLLGYVLAVGFSGVLHGEHLAEAFRAS